MSNTIALIIAAIAPSDDHGACFDCGNALSNHPENDDNIHRLVCFGQYDMWDMNAVEFVDGMTHDELLDCSLCVVRHTGSLLTIDPFQWEAYMTGRGERPVASFAVAAPGSFQYRDSTQSIESIIDSWLEWQNSEPMTRHERAYWGMAPKSELGKHYA